MPANKSGFKAPEFDAALGGCRFGIEFRMDYG